MELSGKSSRDAKSDSSNTGFVRRLAVVEKKFATRKEAAAAAKIAQSTFQRWAEGKAAPNFHGVASLADAAGVSLDWLAYGGEETRHPGSADRVKVSHDLMAELLNDLKDVYLDAGWLILPEEGYKVALDLYREVETKGTISERRADLKSLVRMHAKHAVKPPETANDQNLSSAG